MGDLGSCSSGWRDCCAISARFRGIRRSPNRRRRIVGNDRLLPVEQLDIYREQFWLRHTASLIEDFPGLGGIIGQEDWERLVEGYLTEHAPDSWTLRNLGARLPAYVARATYLPHHEVCVDMARLEWSYIELFDARDVAGIDPGKLSAIAEDAWERAVIVLNPALALLEVDYPVAELRRALREESIAPVPIPERAPKPWSCTETPTAASITRECLSRRSASSRR